MDGGNQNSGEKQYPMIVPDHDVTPHVMSKVDEWEAGLRSVRTSLRCDTDEERALYIKALSVSDVEARSNTGRAFNVVHWLLHTVRRTDDETGELFDALRLALITDDGKVVSTGSPSLIEGWGHVHRNFGVISQWRPLEVQIKAIKASNNRGHYLVIDYVKPLPQPKAGGKTK